MQSNKVTDKQLQLQLEAFKTLCENIVAATPVKKDVSEAAKKKRIDGLVKSFEEFCYYYFPHYCTAKLANFHISVADMLLADKNYKGVEMWARGHAKSVMFNIIIPLWLKAQNEIKVMVLVGKSEDNARTLLSDLQAELQFNKRYNADFGEQMSIGDWTDGKFSTRDGTGFFARGRGQSPRGLRKRQHRPDYIVIDDLDDDELVRSEKRVRLTVDWILEALLGSMEMGRGRFIMVGNNIHKKSCLAKMADVETFHHHQVDVFDTKGKINWADKYTAEEIETQRKTLGNRRFSKEYMNKPIEEGTVFKEDWIHYIRIENYRNYTHALCYIDPSLTGSSSSDYKAAVVIGKTKNGHFHVLRNFVRRCSINVLAKWVYDTYIKAEEAGMVLSFHIEAVFAQDKNLREALKVEGDIRGFHLPLRSDVRQKPDKFLRIEGTSVFFENGFVSFDEKLQKDKDTIQAIEQLTAFEKGSNQNDDWPDAFEGGHHILQWKYQAADSGHKPSFHHHSRQNRY